MSFILSAILILPSLFGDEDQIVSYGITTIINLLFLLYLGNRAAKAGVFDKGNQEPNWKNLAVLSPVVLLFITIPLSVLIFPQYTYFGVYEYWWLIILNDVLIAINDELLFRVFIYKRINKPSRVKKIVTSAFIFSLFELTTILSTHSILTTIFAMIGAFILGLFLGAIVEYGHSIYPAIIFHLLFRLLAYFTGSYGCFFTVVGDIPMILGVLLPLCAFLYLIFIYIFYFKKKE